MKIAIHHRIGSFSDYWITFCKKRNIPFKIVNCFDNDIIEQLGGCDALMWHHHHTQFRDVLAAKRILFAIEHTGKVVFPSFKTSWHFDDKIAQKYLLESMRAPLVPTYMFYDKDQALEWANNTDFPKVFKLKGGSGAKNVKLIRKKREAIRLINKAFNKGFPQFNRWRNLRDRYHQFKSGNGSLLSVGKGLARLILLDQYTKLQCREKGYAYFQDFIPNNSTDTRVVVIKNRAAAEKRLVRPGDFRASGSGQFIYEDINIEAIKIAFNISEKLNLQSVAFDFVEDENANPLVVEMSYGFGTDGIDKVTGYWDENLIWYEGEFNPQEMIIEELIKSLTPSLLK